jgi:type IV secretion system protein VirB3
MGNSDLGSVKTDPLFLGLTRPALIGGVTFPFFALNTLVFLLAFILTSQFKVFIGAVGVHVLGMLICKKEPLAVDILMTKIQKCPGVRNKIFHGGHNSYNMF